MSRILLVLLCFITVAVGCSKLVSNFDSTRAELFSFSKEAKMATLEVKYVDEPYRDINVFKVILITPPGTVIYDGTRETTTAGDDYEIMIIPQYNTNREEAYGALGRMGIELDFYAPNYNFTAFRVVSEAESETLPVERAGDFIQEGSYSLAEGERIVLAAFADLKVEVGIVRWNSHEREVTD